MQVYVVTAGDFYESDSVCCLFMHQADADAYAAQLKGKFDWAEVNLQTVHQESLVAA